MIEKNKAEGRSEPRRGCGDGVFREDPSGGGGGTSEQRPESGGSCASRWISIWGRGKGTCQDPGVGLYWVWSWDGQETSGAGEE